MRDEKAEKIIEAVKNMTDHEADILEVFLSGFRAGKRISDGEAERAVSKKMAQAG